MSVTLARSIKPLALGFALIAIIAAAQTTARADEIVVNGAANGCFGVCTPSTDADTATLLGLTYNHAIFSSRTSGGFLGLGDMGTPPPDTNFGNLGSFSLTGSPADYNGQLFRLLVTFGDLPFQIGAETPTAIFTANLVGGVTRTNEGGVLIDFDNTPQTFSFSRVDQNGQLISGSFTLNVNDVSLRAGGTNVALTGSIFGSETAAVPEPTSVFLLGTGLTAVVGFVRRRRSKAASSQ